MPLNYPGPYQCWIFYDTIVNNITIEHIQKLNLDLDSTPAPGDAFSTIDCKFRTAPASQFLDVAVDNWIAGVKAFYPSGGASTFVRAELWKFAAASFDADFVSSYDLGVAGTSGSGVQSSAQSICTFRTTEGGVMKLSFMESVIVPGGVDPAPYSNSALEALCADVVAGNKYPWIGRDGGWPFARIAHFPGSNEALWKVRNGRR